MTKSSQTPKKKVMILGGGPNRIGQGIEFDYCCVHAAFALKEDGFETIMVNSNPETVSTDYDTSDKLFFEPLTLEDVLHIYEREKCWGAIAQFGGQTPLNLALGLQKNGVNIIGTSPQGIEIAEDRKLFAAMLRKLDIPQPPNGIATNEAEALGGGEEAGLPDAGPPVLRARRTGDADRLFRRRVAALHALRRRSLAGTAGAGGQIPRRRHRSGRGLHRRRRPDSTIRPKAPSSSARMLEHIEFAGVHSGDAAMVLPPHSLSKKVIETIREYTHAMARELKVIGLMNVQYAVKDETVYVPRGQPARVAHGAVCEQGHRRAAGEAGGESDGRQDAQGTRVHAGNLAEVLGGEGIRLPVQPLSRPGHPALAGDAFDRRSHGARTPTWASPTRNRRWRRAGRCRFSGKVFISVSDAHKKHVAEIARQFVDLGFELVATSGTAAVLEKAGLKVQQVFKLKEGRPNALDLLKNREIQLVINTPAGQAPRADEVKIRTTAVYTGTPIMTTLSGAKAAALGIAALKKSGYGVRTLQEYH